MSCTTLTRTDLPGGLLLFTGTTDLVEATSPHVRVCEIRIPVKLTDIVVTATTYGEAPHTPFNIFSIKKNLLGSETQVAIQAQGPIGGLPNVAYACDFAVYGRPKK